MVMYKGRCVVGSCVVEGTGVWWSCIGGGVWSGVV